MYVVIFRARLKQPEALYLETAERLRNLAMQSYGCLDFISMSEGDQEMTLSYWPDKLAIQRWRNDPEHVRAQAMGEQHWYADYRIQVAEVQRDYRHQGESNAFTE